MDIKCNVCGCEFPPVAERHYIARDDGKTGVVAAFRVMRKNSMMHLIARCVVVR